MTGMVGNPGARSASARVTRQHWIDIGDGRPRRHRRARASRSVLPAARDDGVRSSSGGPAITVWRGEAYTATVTRRRRRSGLGAPGSSSSMAIAPRPDIRAISRDRVAITRSPSAAESAPEPLPRDLTHRVPDDRVGPDPVGPPQRGQRQLDSHQHRLDPVDADQRLAPGEHLL